jgi:hypothetical protein
MLTKQAIRKGVKIEHNNKVLTKDEVISLSENWTEKQENFFRKMLRQGGNFNIGGKKFYISVPELIYNNKGEVEATLMENENEQHS